MGKKDLTLYPHIMCYADSNSIFDPIFEHSLKILILTLRVVTISVPWGEVFTMDALKAAIAEHKPKVLGIVHAETSTGTPLLT